MGGLKIEEILYLPGLLMITCSDIAIEACKQHILVSHSVTVRHFEFIKLITISNLKRDNDQSVGGTRHGYLVIVGILQKYLGGVLKCIFNNIRN